MAGGTVPVPTPETAPFWAGTLAGELRIQHCKSCGKHYFWVPSTDASRSSRAAPSVFSSQIRS